MKNWTPYLIALFVALYLVTEFVSREYANIRNAIGETKQKADSVADETKQTIESIRQTIDDLRSKFNVLETQLSAKQPVEQKPIDDVAEVEEKKTGAVIPTSQPTIVMHSASWCGPCQAWKQNMMSRWQSQGWKIEIIEDDATTETVPWFEIIDSDGLRFKSVGQLTRETYLRDRLKALQSRRGATIE